MRILLSREDTSFVACNEAGNYYTFNKEEATDFANHKVADFIKIKEDIEKKEECLLEIYYHHN